MPTDYKSHGTRNEKKPLPGFVWLAIGLAIGLAVAFIIYLDKQPENPMSFGEAVQVELDRLKQPEAESTTEQTATAPARREPKFNFYTILPELEVLIPDSELRLDQDSAGSTRTAPADSKQYLLQAGSFRQRQDADRLKAELALLGMIASIQPVVINKERWYRVRLGPFQTAGDTRRELNRLQLHGISAMAIELKPQ